MPGSLALRAGRSVVMRLGPPVGRGLRRFAAPIGVACLIGALLVNVVMLGLLRDTRLTAQRAATTTSTPTSTAHAAPITSAALASPATSAPTPVATSGTEAVHVLPVNFAGGNQIAPATGRTPATGSGPILPEARLPVLLPLSAVALASLLWLRRRRVGRRASVVAPPGAIMATPSGSVAPVSFPVAAAAVGTVVLLGRRFPGSRR